jgi:aryl-alcohol dehydrogenase-like predicted oxidoreductase
MQHGEAIDYVDAAEQLDTASELGITFLDTAEMYPVPQRDATQGRSEEFVGRWLKGKCR